jgi:cytochrome c
MYTTQFNKFAMALLGVCLLTMGLGVFSSALYSHGPMAKPGLDLPGEVAAAAPAAAAAAEVPLPTLLAKADPAKGQADTKVCQACHNFDKGGVAKVGPPLYGVVGRPVASVAGFGYSDGLKAMGGNWSYESIFKFITKPSAMVQGTKMSFAGESDPAKRADILAYLQTLSDSPVAFPK